jgi:hypothetical protein
MNVSAAIADSALRQASPWFPYRQAGGLASPDLNVLFQVG